LNIVLQNYVISRRYLKTHTIMNEMVGEFAGLIWRALEGKNALSQKEIKKATKLKDKEFYLGLGWLLREDKINVTEGEEENYYALK